MYMANHPRLLPSCEKIVGEQSFIYVERINKQVEALKESVPLNSFYCVIYKTMASLNALISTRKKKD